MSIELEVNGIQYGRFDSASVQISLDTLARAFGFVAISSDDSLLPFKGGESCRIVVDGNQVLSGYIEAVQVSYNSTSHTISIIGRDKVGDLVDSTLNALEINPPISLKKVIEKVLNQIGLDILVIDNTDISDFTEAEDKLGPSVGQNAFEFIETLARKRQVLLTSDENGNVIITRSEPELLQTARLVMRKSGNGNNILSGSVSYDHMDRFRDYIIKSQQNVASLSLTGDVDLASVVDQGGGIQDTQIRKGRQLVIKSEKSSGSQRDIERATWEANIRATRSQVYSAQVQGFSNINGDLWEINKLVDVIDEYCDISARMLINTINFNLDLNSGDTTTLGLVVKDSYQVALEEPQPTDDVGTGLFL